MSKILDRWKKAVVHLEAAGDSISVGEMMRRSQAKPYEALSQHLRSIRAWGTAVFVAAAGRDYLITAKHVVHDERGAEGAIRDLEEELRRWADGEEETPPPYRHIADFPAHRIKFLTARLEDARNNASEVGYPIIFRVPSIDELRSGKTPQESLKFIGSHSFSTLSDDDTDLAVIALHGPNRRFGTELLAQGFVPISADDIVDEPSSEGAEVFTVGYPYSPVTFGPTIEPPSEAMWSATHYSVPAFAFGRISMLNPHLIRLLADLSVYRGNSGGPLVEADRLVGIVTAQAFLSGLESPQGEMLDEEAMIPIPFGWVVKGAHVRTLLSVQLEKDRHGAPPTGSVSAVALGE